MITICDVENKGTRKPHADPSKKDVLDISPYYPDNYLVSVGLCDDNAVSVDYYVTQHDQQPQPCAEGMERIQQRLDGTSLLVGHNIRHDLEWLLESGFKYDGPVWDTMVAEYVLSRAVKKDLSLKGLCIEHDLTRKKSDLVDEYFEKGHTANQIPLDILIEYGKGDCISTAELYQRQVKELEKEENKCLLPTIHMMNDYLRCLLEIRHNGIYIDKAKLLEIKKEFELEQQTIKNRLTDICRQVLGNVEINLNSPDFKSKLIFSRELLDKETWKDIFNIGTDAYGKAKRKPNYKDSIFHTYIRRYTKVIRKKRALKCPDCDDGYFQKYKADGTPYKKMNKCKTCDNKGVLYQDLKEVGGLKQIPKGIEWTSASGFATNKEVLKQLLEEASDETVKEVLTGLIRLEALDTYINTFIIGILTHLDDNSYLHPNFLQCVTFTGRLSCNEPNLLNQPRGFTFPIKGAFVSRFGDEGGIIEVDQRQLEFRTAGFLSGCKSVLQDILDEIDAHANTRDIINAFDKSLPAISRQDSKSHTFKPLYGGSSGTPRQIHYYEWFMQRYKGISEWHKKLIQEVLETGKVRLPSGREYRFPFARRLKNGYVKETTKIVNYPVQGFATADLVPIWVMCVQDDFKENNLRSVIFLTVHDSIEIDYHVSELEKIIEILEKSVDKLKEWVYNIYNINLDYPFDYEMKLGPSWYEVKDYVRH